MFLPLLENCHSKKFQGANVLTASSQTLVIVVSTQNVPKVAEGKSQGNNKTTLRKEVGFLLPREGSLIDF